MRFILLAIAVLLPALLHAQDGRSVRCRFVSFGSVGPDPTALAVSDKGGEVTCSLPGSQLSEPVMCTAKNNVISFLSPSDRKPLASATIPAGVSAAVLVFVKTPQKPDAAAEASPWRVMVIEDSPKNFPDGGAFVANFYNSDIRFVIGEHKGTLRAGGSHGYAMPAERDTFNMAAVVFEFIQNDKWRTANESSLRFLPGMRYLIFAYVDPTSGRPRIKTYQDMAAPAPAAAP